MHTSYGLGIDVGSTSVSAATARLTRDGQTHVEDVPIGRREQSAPAAVFVEADGGLVYGEAAERRGVAEPAHLVREYSRSVGDEMPLSVNGHQVRSEDLVAGAVASVLESTSQREGAAPATVTVTHPASWGPHRLALVSEALDRAGVADANLIPKPLAVALDHDATQPMEAGRHLAVYTLGGTSAEAAMVRKNDDGSMTVQATASREIGGADIDDLVLGHVLRSSGVTDLDVESDAAMAAVVQLRKECVEAKEALSYDTEVTIPVLLPGSVTKVRLTRTEFESMIEQRLSTSFDALQDALDTAHLGASDLDAIVLAGGSSRIPRVVQSLSELYDRPIVTDADPEFSAVRGAARYTSRMSDGAVTPGLGLAVTEPDPGSQRTEVLDITATQAGEPDGSRGIRRKTVARVASTAVLATLSVAGAILIGYLLMDDGSGQVSQAGPTAAASLTAGAPDAEDAGPSASSAQPPAPAALQPGQTDAQPQTRPGAVPGADGAADPGPPEQGQEAPAGSRTIYVTMEPETTTVRPPASDPTSARPPATTPPATTPPRATPTPPRATPTPPRATPTPPRTIIPSPPATTTPPPEPSPTSSTPDTTMPAGNPDPSTTENQPAAAGPSDAPVSV